MTIYGPVTRTMNLPGLKYKSQTWYRQKPITDKPLAYSMDTYWRVAGEINATTWSFTALNTANPEWTILSNRLYDKIVSRVKGASSAWGSNLATWKQSHGMIVSRALQLATAVVQVKNGHFRSAAKTLGIRKPKKRHARDLSGQWLELSYGWIPLVQDIHNSVDVLTRPLPPLKVTARVSHSNTTHPVPTEFRDWHRRMSCGCKIKAIHQNALLASQLGLVNPASVAWEVVPFSFVIDWFVPVGRFLESFTDFVGVDLSDTWTTQIADVTVQYVAPNTPGVKRRVQMKRSLNFPSYKLQPRFTGFYSMRGANAIALLIGGLKSLR